MDEVRRVRRHEGEWILRPANYFQWHHFYGLSDEVLKVLKRCCQPADTVFDVGANIGLYAVCMARAVGRDGCVYAFEPNPQTHQDLRNHVTMNAVPQVLPQNYAVGSEIGTAVLNAVQTKDAGKCSLRTEEVDLAVAKVPVTTIDAFVAEHQIASVDVLKIDVEGFEPEALLGAKRTIMNHWPTLCLELTPRWYQGKEATLQKAMDWGKAAPYAYFEIREDGLVPFDLRGFLSALSVRKPQKNIIALPEHRRFIAESLRADLH